MRLHRWLSSTALLLFCAKSLCAAEPETKPLELDNGVVCRVNTEAISKRDVENRMGEVGALLRDRADQWKAAGQWNEETERKWNEEYIPEFRIALRKLVRERLMLQQAKDEKITVDPKALDKHFQSTMARIRAQNPMLLRSLTAADIQTNLREQMLLDQFRARFSDALELPSRPEVQQYYKANIGRYQRPAGVKVRLIRIDRFVTNNLTTPPTKSLRENSYELAEELRKDIDQYGGKFEEIAKKHSDDVESRARGGLVVLNNKDEFIDPESYSSQLARAIRGVEPGRVSGVFEFGQTSWAIAQVVARREAGAAPLEGNLYEEIYNALVELKSRKREDEWFRKAFSKALVIHVVEGVPKSLPLEFFFPDDKETPASADPKNAKPGVSEIR